MCVELHPRRLNQEKFMAASDIIDRLEVTPRDLGLEASVAHDKALRRLFARYYGRLSAEHTRVQIQVIPFNKHSSVQSQNNFHEYG